MITESEVSYRVRNDSRGGGLRVEIWGELPPIVLNRESVEKAIAIVKSQRDSFVTEEYFLRMLARYEGALQALDVAENKVPS